MSQEQKYWLLHSYKVNCTKHIRVLMDSMSTPRTPWTVHKHSTDSMSTPWALLMDSMSSPWTVHGVHEHSMSSPWTVHGQSMSTPWGPWAVHEQSMSTPWALHEHYEQSMSSPWEPVGDCKIQWSLVSGYRLLAMRTMFQNKVLPYREGELGYSFWWLHSSMD